MNTALAPLMQLTGWRLRAPRLLRSARAQALPGFGANCWPMVDFVTRERKLMTSAFASR
jgi:hypothetical protein